MPAGVTFESLEEANEYVEVLKAEGMNGRVVHDKNAGKYKVYIVARHIADTAEKVKEHREPPVKSAQIGSFARWVGKGLRDAGQSLGTPATERRPRIAQLPSRRGAIGVAQEVNLDYIKAPGLRRTTLSGRPRDTSD